MRKELWETLLERYHKETGTELCPGAMELLRERAADRENWRVYELLEDHRISAMTAIQDVLRHILAIGHLLAEHPEAKPRKFTASFVHMALKLQERHPIVARACTYRRMSPAAREGFSQLLRIPKHECPDTLLSELVSILNDKVPE